jgi:hypothetical protein
LKATHDDTAGSGPPTAVSSGERCDHAGILGVETEGSKLAEDVPPVLPLLELQSTETTSDPAVMLLKGRLGLGETKVRLPADEITAQVGDHLLDAATNHPSRELPHAILQFLDGLRGHTETYFFPCEPKEGEAEELSARGLVHGALRGVDPEPESRKETLEHLEHALAGPL